jgi:anti-anti-sigma factor
MKFTVDKREKYLILQLNEKRLDTTVAPSLKSEFVILNNEGYRNMIVDLSEVTMADSSGLGALLIGRRMSRNSLGTFVVFGVQPNVMKTIEISQLKEILNIVGSEEEANDLILMEEVQREIERESSQSN